MRLPPAAIDTNVVVSGMLTADPESPTARILDGMLEGRFSYLLSIELLAEYREVLLRPRIRKVHRLSDAEIDVLLTAIALNAIVVAPAESPEAAPDRGDQHLWNLIHAYPGSILVSGDALLLQSTRVVPPREFIRLLEG
ncbi:MAG: putative toxin-antitoxin system toxin component, PIN family [Thermoanaerobaculia bacterium]